MRPVRLRWAQLVPSAALSSTIQSCLAKNSTSASKVSDNSLLDIRTMTDVHARMPGVCKMLLCSNRVLSRLDLPESVSPTTVITVCGRDDSFSILYTVSLQVSTCWTDEYCARSYRISFSWGTITFPSARRDFSSAGLTVLYITL